MIQVLVRFEEFHARFIRVHLVYGFVFVASNGYGFVRVYYPYM